MLRWSLRTAQRQQVVASVVQTGDRGQVQLEAVDEKGDFVNFVDATIGVVAPDKTQRVSPSPDGPRPLPGRLRRAGEGAYLVGVAERKDQKMVGSEVASLVVPYSPEHRALAADEGPPRDLITRSGGAAPSEPGHVSPRTGAGPGADGGLAVSAGAGAPLLPGGCRAPTISEARGAGETNDESGLFRRSAASAGVRGGRFEVTCNAEKSEEGPQMGERTGTGRQQGGTFF